jgi:hypothetical protein
MNRRRPDQLVRLGDRPRRGQTLIFLMMVLAILTFVMFSVYDVQQVAVQRVRSQNGSDAAALAGARWQVATLNAIGEINLLKVTTAAIDMPPDPYAPGVPFDQWRQLYADLDELQDRIKVTGTLLGVLYAQQAAKLNGMHAVEEFAEMFRDAMTYISTHPMDYPAYYQQEVVPLLQEIVNQGVAALPAGSLGDPGSVDFSGATGWARYLVDRRFYSAVGSRDWCFLRPLLFAPYTDCLSFWGIIGPGAPPDPLAFLPLWIHLQDNAVSVLGPANAVVQRLIDDRGQNRNPNAYWPPPNPPDTNFPQFYFPDPPYDPYYVPLQLYVYGSRWNWGANDDNLTDILLRSPFKPQFKYNGADSVWMVQGVANMVMAPDDPSRISWTAEGQQAGLGAAFARLGSIKQQAGETGHGIVGSAAAKPFGQIAGDPPSPPNAVPVVLPLFDTVRLIPIAFSSATGQFDPIWFTHLRDHLNPYTTQGINAISPGCPFCRQLIVWEDPTFRQIGIDWWNSQTNANPCPAGGGGNNGRGIIAH